MDSFPFFNPGGKTAEVAVHGLITLVMFDDHLFPISSVPSAEGDGSVGYGPDGTACRCGIINSIMRTGSPQDRMPPGFRIRGANPGKLQRGAQKIFLQGFSLGRVKPP